MRYLALLVYAFLQLSTLTAQPFFIRYYDSGGDERARHCTAINGRIVLTGNSTAAADRLTGIANFLGPEGDLLHSVVVDTNLRTLFFETQPLTGNPDADWLVGAMQNNSGTLDDVVFHRLGPNAEPRGSFGWGFPTEDEELQRLQRLVNGDFLVIGNIGTSDAARIHRFDREGNTRWRSTLSVPDSRFNVFQDVVEVPGALLLSGYSTQDERFGELFVAKFLPTGELLWHYLYDYPRQSDEGIHSLSVLPNGDLFVITRIIGDDRFTDALLLRLSPTGEVLSQAILSGAGDLVINDCHVTPTGSLLLAGGLSVTENGLQALVVEIDPDGNILRQRTVGHARFSALHDIEPAPGGGYYLAGYGTFCDDLGAEDADMLLAYLDERLENSLERCSPLRADLEVLPAAAAVTNRSPATLQSRQEASVYVVRPGPTVTTAITFNCPSLDADLDDSSAPATTNGFRVDAACYETPLPVVDRDVGFDFADPPPRLVTVALTDGFAEGGAEFLAVPPALAGLVVGNNSASIAVRPDRLPDSLSVIDVLRAISYHNEAGTIIIGTRIVSGTVNYGCGLTSSFQTEISLSDAPLGSPRHRDTSLCADETWLFDGTATGADSFRWNDGTERATRLLRDPGTYYLSLTNDCSERIDTIVIHDATAGFTPPSYPPRDLCPEDSVLLDLSTPNVNVYRWGDGFIGSVRTLSEPGTYTVVLANACTETTVEIPLVGQACCQVYLPTAFSPNGDGINDRFRPLSTGNACAGLRDWSLAIYDRWGGEVFRTNDPAEGWDGRVAGEAAPAGLYVFSLTYFDGLRDKAHRESVVLLR